MADEKDEPLGAAKRKLVESKERWAREGRLLTGHPTPPAEQRLPPGQRQVTNWPVLDLGVQPDVPAERWQLTIDGVVETPVTWDWAAFRAQPAFRDVSDIRCVTAWSRFDNAWDGISAKYIPATVRPRPEARFIVFHSYDDYTTNLPLAEFDADDVLLAHSWQGRPLPREHGGPVRAIAPRLYISGRAPSGSGASSSSPPTALGLLGGAGISRPRRPLDGGALWLTRRDAASPSSSRSALPSPRPPSRRNPHGEPA